MTVMEHRDAVESLATERYLLGEMNEAERAEFEAHFFSCPDCADDVRAGALMRDGVRQGLLGAPARASLPDNVVRMPRVRTWRSSTVLPWAVAATLAVIVGYQARSARSSTSRFAGGIVALSPTTLRPATRGREQM